MEGQTDSQRFSWGGQRLLGQGLPPVACPSLTSCPPSGPSTTSSSIWLLPTTSLGFSAASQNLLPEPTASNHLFFTPRDPLPT